MTKEIPSDSTQIQDGLWVHSYIKIINNNTYIFRELYSSIGYCFYDKTDEVYREKDNEFYLVPESEILPQERKYMQYASLGINKNIEDFVSVVVQQNYEIV